VTGLILNGGNARTAWAADYPWGMREEDWEKDHARIPEIWGVERHAREWAEMSWLLGPDDVDDPDLMRWASRWARYSAAPGDMLAFDEMWMATDVRDVLPAIRTPTVVISAPGAHSEEAAWVASRIPQARLLEFPGAHRVVWMSDLDELGQAVGTLMHVIQEEEASFERVLATVLFTDIVDSTSQSAAVGDRAWRTVQEAHDQIVRAQVARYRGREIRRMGDGFLATFDGPGRAVRCARAIAAGVASLGIEIRAGLHTGEIDLDGDDIAGITVAIGARVGALAGPSEVLVSSTVKDLVVGSGLALEDRGVHTLKGVPGEWRLFAVRD